MLRIAVWLPSVTIGVITALASLLGIFPGARLQLGLGRKAEIVGGVILVAIAIRIVVSHTVP